MSVNGEKIDRICKYCLKEFKILKSKLKTNSSGNFCSRPCYNKHLKTLTGKKNKGYKRVKKQCAECGTELEVIPSRLKRKSFCSKKCKGDFYSREFSGKNSPLWRGGHKERRGNFEQVKRKYFKGINFCAVCGTTKKIHIHHIVPFRYSEDNSISNLIPLCVGCHRKIEAITFKMIDVGFSNKQLKFYMSNILRDRQLLTFMKIRNKNGKT